MHLHNTVCKPHLALALLVLATAPARGADAVQPISLKPLSLDLVVTREGKAIDIKCPAQFSAPICQAVVKGVSEWSFAPGRRDNAAADIAIRLVLKLDAIAGANGYQLKPRQAEVLLPGASGSSEAWMAARSKHRPVYPTEELKRGSFALVTLELWAQPDSPLPRIGRTWINHGAPGKRDRFVDAATAAARNWPLDYLAPEQKSTCMNVEFSLGLSPGGHDAQTKPCEPSYIEGFAPPKLLTDVSTATL